MMSNRKLPGCLFLGLLLTIVVAPLRGDTNLWPFVTHWNADEVGRPETTTALAPFIEHKIYEKPAGETRIFSFRPFFTSFSKPWPEVSHRHVLYPIFNYYESEEDYHWNVIFLLRGSSRDRNEPDETDKLEIWPFWFSRSTQEKETSYQALWPVAGETQDLLWRDRIEFFVWPLYVRTENEGEIRTHTPYPFFQRRSGPESSGWGLWPIYGHFQRDNDYDHTWALWPFYYDFEDDLDLPIKHTRFGVLPFYTSERYAGFEMKNYLWPFFGTTHQSDPLAAYREVRYFWPFIVQGRGEERHVNRVFPLYSILRKPGYEKRWTLWPLWKTESRVIGPESRTERQTLLFFIYFNELQTAPDFQARKNFLWPVYGYWNDGNGRRQFQLLDPLSPIFKYNETIRENWTPFFALYRYDARGQDTRHSALWNLIVVENEPGDTGAFYLGPLYETVDNGASGHWEVLKGLVGRERDPAGSYWRLLWMDIGR